MDFYQTDTFQTFINMGSYLPINVKWWMHWMQCVLLLTPFFYLKYPSVRILMLAQVLNFSLAYLVFEWEQQKVTKLFGIGHIFWVWPAVLFYLDIQKRHGSKPYLAFAGIALVTISISLVFDTRDTVLWMMGDRESILTPPN